MLAFDMTPWEAVRVHMILAIQNTLKAVARIWEGAEIIVVVAPRGMENVFGTLRRWGHTECNMCACRCWCFGG